MEYIFGFPFFFFYLYNIHVHHCVTTKKYFLHISLWAQMIRKFVYVISRIAIRLATSRPHEFHGRKAVKRAESQAAQAQDVRRRSSCET